jgi:hypothetical protein
MADPELGVKWREVYASEEWWYATATSDQGLTQEFLQVQGDPGAWSLLVRRAVDALAEQVSMPVVLGILLDHVDDHGAH